MMLDKIKQFYAKYSTSVCLLFILLVNILVWGKYLNLSNITNGDEYESLAIPFQLLGYRWAHITTFHGFGATVLLTPFIYLFKGIGAPYLLFLVEALFFRVITATVTFYLFKKFELSNLYSLVMTLVVEFGMLGSTSESGLSAMTEIPLTLVTVSSLLIIYKIFLHKNSQQALWILLLGAMLGYSMTIHTRGIVLFFGTAFVLIAESVRKKFFFKSNLILFIWPLFYFAAEILISLVRNNFYSSESDSNTVSGFVKYAVGTNAIDIVKVKQVFINFFSILGAYIYWSFGVITLFVVAEIIYLLKKRNETNDILWILTLYGLVLFFTMNFLISYVSYDVVRKGQFRWLVYVRYSLPFAIVIVTNGIVILTRVSFRKKIWLGIAGINVLCGKLFLNYVPEMLDKGGNGLNNTSFNMFSVLPLTDNTANEYFSKLFLVVTFVSLLMIISRKCNLIYFVYVFLSMLVIFQQRDITFQRDIQRTKYYYSSLNAYRAIDTSTLDSVYVHGNNWRYYYNLEFQMAYIKDLGYKEGEDLSNSVLFSNEKMDVEKSIYEVVLDTQQYAYTGNIEVYEKLLEFEQQGASKNE
ncbi:hypothetical protein [Butyrivibrio sp. YAB3001]|uniref:hypothetical protein n=1 Tax=Butyrivibrio sp. YAB3001 TaxID=1520812 RepID=UPI0008F68CA6|nr:hypothetical protein [Butyrivibrio sp. YAB3001]SFC98337.1 hypothetical protein SAMN02910398_03702 [Butyrivibrio sp. YAB3001]